MVDGIRVLIILFGSAQAQFQINYLYLTMNCCYALLLLVGLRELSLSWEALVTWLFDVPLSSALFLLECFFSKRCKILHCKQHDLAWKSKGSPLRCGPWMSELMCLKILNPLNSLFLKKRFSLISPRPFDIADLYSLRINSF